MIEIPINGKYGGKSAIVDDEFAYLAKFCWSADRHGYARRTIYNKDTKTIFRKFMHHEICPRKGNLVTDHINRNKFDNRKSNLRLITRSDNNRNRDDCYHVRLKKRNYIPLLQTNRRTDTSHGRRWSGYMISLGVDGKIKRTYLKGADTKKEIEQRFIALLGTCVN